ncbi:hypothetical protein [Nocardioides sp.]|uniref:hypothetical protein n=1 Tax=Nocardioides sp. TaxID=35761 RepID=UPI003519A976
MSTPRRPLLRLTSRTAAAALAVLLGAAALTGCGGDDAADNAAERQIEDAMASNGIEGDVDVEDGEVSVDTGDGSFSTGSDLPDGFPADVPLVDGEVQFGMATDENGQEGYAVSIEVDADPDAALAEAGGLLEDAGYTGDDSLGAGGGNFSNGTYNVFVFATANPDTSGSIVQYAVAPENG